MDLNAKGLNENAAASLPPGEAQPLQQRLESIHATRERLGDTYDELSEEARERLDWRHWVRRRPLTSVAMAAGAGLLLGRIALGGRRRRLPVRRDKAAPAAVGAGLGALIGSALLSHLGPIVIERGMEYMLKRLGLGPREAEELDDRDDTDSQDDRD